MSKIKTWDEATKPFRDAVKKSEFTKTDFNRSKLIEKNVKRLNKKIKSLATKRFLECK